MKKERKHVGAGQEERSVAFNEAEGGTLGMRVASAKDTEIEITYMYP